MAVPNECLGVLLGKSGETIRNIQQKAEALNIQISADSNNGKDTRNIYVEGSEDCFKRVKILIDEIVNTHMKMKVAFTDSDTASGLRAQVTLSIPVNTLSTVVGKNGDSLM
jgi:far upstream element-binding protein